MKDLNLLYVFEALWRDRSVTQAAESLGVTQAAVSGGLKRLRTVYNDKLFMLIGRKMEPTPLAISLSQPLLESLGVVRNTSGYVGEFHPRDSRKTFVIRTRDVGEVVYLPALYNEVSKSAPKVKLQTVFTGIEETMQGLAAGRIDLALGYLPALARNIHMKALFKQGYLCVMRRRHPLASRKITLERFIGQDHLLVEYSGSGHILLERALVNAGAKNRIKVRMPQYLAAPHLISQSDLIWTAPESLAIELCKHYDLVAKPLPLVMEQYEVGIYWHDRFHTDPANMWLREKVAACVDPAAIIKASRSHQAASRTQGLPSGDPTRH